MRVTLVVASVYAGVVLSAPAVETANIAQAPAEYSPWWSGSSSSSTPAEKSKPSGWLSWLGLGSSPDTDTDTDSGSSWSSLFGGSGGRRGSKPEANSGSSWSSLFGGNSGRRGSKPEADSGSSWSSLFGGNGGRRGSGTKDSGSSWSSMLNGGYGGRQESDSDSDTGSSWSSMFNGGSGGRKEDSGSSWSSLFGGGRSGGRRGSDAGDYSWLRGGLGSQPAANPYSQYSGYSGSSGLGGYGAYQGYGSYAPKPQAPKPEVPKPEVPKPEVPKPEVPKPEVPQPEAPKPEAPKPEAPKPEAPKPEVPQPEAPKPKVPQLEESKPDISMPDVSKPEIPKVEATKAATEVSATPVATILPAKANGTAAIPAKESPKTQVPSPLPGSWFRPNAASSTPPKPADAPEIEGDTIPGDARVRKHGVWQPKVAEPFQIILTGHPDTGVKLAPDYVNIFDLDLFNTPASTIKTLRDQGKKVICYFSAGSSEDWRPDYKQFSRAEMGNKVSKDDAGSSYWEGEKWLNIKNPNPASPNLPNVWKIMRERIKLASQKGCNAIDPDNTGMLK
jgi:Glycoside-hydrolase family GH114